MTRNLKLPKGAKVRLLRDIITRGGSTFRAGLVMKVQCTDREYHLDVCVRAKWHFLRIRKMDARRYLVLLTTPEPSEVSDECDTAEGRD